MTDRGSFKAQSDALRRAAGMWGTASGDMDKAVTEVTPGVGGGDSFGVLAGSSGVSGHYNEWSQEMLTALKTGRDNFDYLDAALTSTANDYDGVDSTVATDLATLDGMIDHG